MSHNIVNVILQVFRVSVSDTLRDVKCQIPCGIITSFFKVVFWKSMERMESGMAK
ncbi:MAG: hypothetical protein LBK25_07690 [Treponema sp.]|nr:hypothetical protein [Treponema sp.]